MANKINYQKLMEDLKKSMKNKDVIRYYKNNWNLGETIVEINI